MLFWRATTTRAVFSLMTGQLPAFCFTYFLHSMYNYKHVKYHSDTEKSIYIRAILNVHNLPVTSEKPIVRKQKPHFL